MEKRKSKLPARELLFGSRGWAFSVAGLTLVLKRVRSTSRGSGGCAQPWDESPNPASGVCQRKPSACLPVRDRVDGTGVFMSSLPVPLLPGDGSLQNVCAELNLCLGQNETSRTALNGDRGRLFNARSAAPSACGCSVVSCPVPSERAPAGRCWFAKRWRQWASAVPLTRWQGVLRLGRGAPQGDRPTPVPQPRL